jgi:hypothetical protein
MAVAAPPQDGTAKTAASGVRAESGLQASFAHQKNELESDSRQIVRESNKPAGMGGAQLAPAVSSSLNPPAAAPSDPAVGVRTPEPAAALLVPAPTQPSSAHPPAGSVEGTLAITDLQAAQSDAVRNSVKLKFQVGDDNLSVRVALQGDQVHTQFATDSAELRGALAHEWPTLAAQPGAAVHYAPPSIAGGGAATDSSTGQAPGQSLDPEAGQGRRGHGNDPRESSFAPPSSGDDADAAPEVPVTQPVLVGGHALEAIA